MSETVPSLTGELPDAEDVNDSLLRYYRYDLYSGDFEEFKHCMDTVAPVQLHFITTVTPDVDVAPDHIRDQWLGLRLPVRSKRYVEQDGEEGFVVRSREALEILRLERPEAYAWWQQYYINQRVAADEKERAQHEELYGRDHDFYYSEFARKNLEFPEYFANMDWFIFYPRWGVAVPEPDFKDALANEPLLQQPGQAPDKP